MPKPHYRSIWSGPEPYQVCDADILNETIDRAAIQLGPPLDEDRVYAAFLTVKVASEGWFKHYAGAIALLVLAHLKVLREATLYGFRFDSEYLAAAAIVALAICTVAFTNHEIKLRLYRAYFNARLTAADGPDRAAILLRFPGAFMGPEFHAIESRPKHIMISFGQVVSMLPLLLAIALGALVFFVISSLALSATINVVRGDALAWYVRLGVIGVEAVAILLSLHLLRSPKRPHRYGWR